MRLWDLHRYESARSSGSNALTYHINAQHILDDQGYWLDYRWVGAGPQGLALLFGNVKCNLRTTRATGWIKGGWMQSCRAFVGSAEQQHRQKDNRQ